MVIRGRELPTAHGRKPYPLPSGVGPLEHFVMRVTTPETPFPPHRHEGSELWYIVEGEARLCLDGVEQIAQGGDLIVLRPGVEHGLRTQREVTWICLA